VLDNILGERIARHGFTSRPARTAAEAVALTTAIQAQDHPAARLGVRARSRGLRDADVLEAVGSDRSVVRTWLMRGTIHLVNTADLRWLVALIGPSIERKYATRWRQLGLSSNVLSHCDRALPEILADGPRTRAEVVAGLAQHGIALDSSDPQAAAHVLGSASCSGLVCRAADRGRTATFALVDDWVPASPVGPRGDDAVAELARRYFQAYSPATAVDFATWSGIAAGRAIALIRDELAPVDVYGKPGFRYGEVEPARGLRLLPAFDNYLIGYKDRGFIDDARRGEVYVGGVIRPTVLLDGRVVGRWQLVDRTKVEVTLFEELNTTNRRALDREIADIGTFLTSPG
jgi:hypothetical protein